MTTLESWYYLAPDGCYYGPAPFGKMEHWLRRGKIPHSTPIAPAAHGPFFPATHYWNPDSGRLKTQVHLDSWFFRVQDRVSEPEQGPFTMNECAVLYYQQEVLKPESMIRVADLSAGDYCLQDVWPQWDEVFRLAKPPEQEMVGEPGSRKSTTVIEHEQPPDEQTGGAADKTPEPGQMLAIMGDFKLVQIDANGGLREKLAPMGEETAATPGSNNDGAALSLGKPEYRIEGDWFYGESGQNRLRITDGLEVCDFLLSILAEGELAECSLRAEENGWNIGHLPNRGTIAVKRHNLVYLETKFRPQGASGWFASVFAWPRFSFMVKGAFRGPFSNSQCRTWFLERRFDDKETTMFRLGNDPEHRAHTLRELFPKGGCFALEALPSSLNPGGEPTLAPDATQAGSTSGVIIGGRPSRSSQQQSVAFGKPTVVPSPEVVVAAPRTTSSSGSRPGSTTTAQQSPPSVAFGQPSVVYNRGGSQQQQVSAAVPFGQSGGPYFFDEQQPGSSTGATRGGGQQSIAAAAFGQKNNSVAFGAGQHQPSVAFGQPSVVFGQPSVRETRAQGASGIFPFGQSVVELPPASSDVTSSALAQEVFLQSGETAGTAGQRSSGQSSAVHLRTSSMTQQQAPTSRSYYGSSETAGVMTSSSGTGSLYFRSSNLNPNAPLQGPRSGAGSSTSSSINLLQFPSSYNSTGLQSRSSELGASRSSGSSRAGGGSQVLAQPPEPSSYSSGSQVILPENSSMQQLPFSRGSQQQQMLPGSGNEMPPPGGSMNFPASSASSAGINKNSVVIRGSTSRVDNQDLFEEQIGGQAGTSVYFGRDSGQQQEDQHGGSLYFRPSSVFEDPKASNVSDRSMPSMQHAAAASSYYPWSGASEGSNPAARPSSSSRGGTTPNSQQEHQEQQVGILRSQNEEAQGSSSVYYGGTSVRFSDGEHQASMIYTAPEQLVRQAEGRGSSFVASSSSSSRPGSGAHMYSNIPPASDASLPSSLYASEMGSLGLREQAAVRGGLPGSMEDYPLDHDPYSSTAATANNVAAGAPVILNASAPRMQRALSSIREEGSIGAGVAAQQVGMSSTASLDQQRFRNGGSMMPLDQQRAMNSTGSILLQQNADAAGRTLSSMVSLDQQRANGSAFGQQRPLGASLVQEPFRSSMRPLGSGMLGLGSSYENRSSLM
ncbi:unnamed protein product [Amoebophrya sp. A120]|nr:unnamed protein product [Amoebophrya sp. A120]|eukprot:GSA120T00011981001.1